MSKGSVVLRPGHDIEQLRRALWAIAHRPPAFCTEVVVLTEGVAGALEELRQYSSRFEWRLVVLGAGERALAEITLEQTRGELVFEQESGLIPWATCYDRMLFDAPVNLPEFSGTRKFWRVGANTYDLPAQFAARLDHYGSNLARGIVEQLIRWPVYTYEFQAGQPCLTLSPRALLEELVRSGQPAESLDRFRYEVSGATSVRLGAQPQQERKASVANVVSSF